jgi:hypothetical protein
MAPGSYRSRRDSGFPALIWRRWLKCITKNPALCIIGRDFIVLLRDLEIQVPPAIAAATLPEERLVFNTPHGQGVHASRRLAVTCGGDISQLVGVLLRAATTRNVLAVGNGRSSRGGMAVGRSLGLRFESGAERQTRYQQGCYAQAIQKLFHGF